MRLIYGIFFALVNFTTALPARDQSSVQAIADVHKIEENGFKSAITRAELDTLIYYSEWSAAAYCGPQLGKTGGKVTCGSAGTCPRVEKSKTNVYATWYMDSDQSKNGATGFVGADHTNKNIVVSMRGSVGLANWIADVNAKQIPCTQFTKDSLCSTGFLGFWNDSRAVATKGLENGLKDNPSYNIIVTGHSLGGAAAVFAAGEYRQQYSNKKVTLYTYGQPRAGNEALSKFITDQGNNFRVTHTSDAVPKLPPEGGGKMVYKHISPEYWISTGLGNKPENIQVIHGLTSEGGNAGTGQLAFNIVAHIQYFQTNMYYCALPLPMGWMGGAGTKKYANVEAFDRATNVTELREMGVNNVLTQEIPILQ